MSDDLDRVIASLTSDYSQYEEVFTLRDEVLASVAKKPRRYRDDAARYNPPAEHYNLICDGWHCTEPGIFTIEGIYCPRKPADPRALYLGEAVSRRWYCGVHYNWVLRMLGEFGVNHRSANTAESWARLHGGYRVEWGLDVCGHFQNNDGRGHKLPCAICQTPPRGE